MLHYLLDPVKKFVLFTCVQENVLMVHHVDLIILETGKLSLMMEEKEWTYNMPYSPHPACCVFG
jgi:hypothetical protein